MTINGWDLIYGCSAEAVNKYLSDSSERFSVSGEYSDNLTGVKLKLTVNKWQLCAGGNSGIVKMKVYSDCALESPIQQVINIVSEIKIPLSFVSIGGSVSDSCCVLRDDSDIQRGLTGQLIVQAGLEESCEVLDVDTLKNIPSEWGDSASIVISSALKNVLQQNREKIKSVFAQITFQDDGVKSFKYSWYEPVVKHNIGYLVILAVTDDRDISNLPVVIDGNLLYDNNGNYYNSVYMIAAKRFMQECVMPELQKIFKGSSLNNYKVDGESIINNGNIPLNSVRAGAIDYDPYMTQFKCCIQDNVIAIRLSGRCPIKGLTSAYVDFSLSSKHKVSYNPNLNQIRLERDSQMVVTTNKDIPTWEKFIGILSAGILNLVMEAISDSLEDSISDILTQSQISASNMGFIDVKWIGIGKNAEGGCSDNIYIRSK